MPVTERFDVLKAHRSVLEAASWRLCAELARRHPEELRIVETHPGGGQYYCLTAATCGEQPRAVLDANRVGSIHAQRTDGTRSTWTWIDYLTCQNPRRFLAEVERALRLPHVVSVPPATPPTLTWRCIAAALASEVLGVRHLRALNGFLDTSGGGGGPRTELFDAFPPAQATLGALKHAGAAYRYWFLLTGEEPVAVVDSETSQCW